LWWSLFDYFRIWDVCTDDGQLIVWKAHDAWITHVDCKENFLLSTAYDGMVKMWNMKDVSRPCISFEAHAGTCNAVLFAGKERAVSCGDDMFLKGYLIFSISSSHPFLGLGLKEGMFNLGCNGTFKLYFHNIPFFQRKSGKRII